jgi:hypothetical protein
MWIPNSAIQQFTQLDEELIVLILGLLLYYFHYFYKDNIFIITNIIITTFVVSLYDVFIRKILLFNVCDEYYKLVINNTITIIIISFLSTIIKNFNDNNLNFVYYFNLAFACFFYETIVFKLYNYNNICDTRLRNVTKTIMRLATIHIMSSFLNDTDFNKKWFDFSFGQLFNFALFNTVFIE